MHNMLGLVKWVLVIALWLGCLGLVLANLATVTPFTLVPGFWLVERMPLSVLLITIFLAVFCVFWVVGVLDQMDNLLQARTLKKRIGELEAEVRQLRNLPIREGLRTERALEGESAP